MSLESSRVSREGDEQNPNSEQGVATMTGKSTPNIIYYLTQRVDGVKNLNVTILEYDDCHRMIDECDVLVKKYHLRIFELFEFHEKYYAISFVPIPTVRLRKVLKASSAKNKHHLDKMNRLLMPYLQGVNGSDVQPRWVGRVNQYFKETRILVSKGHYHALEPLIIYEQDEEYSPYKSRVEVGRDKYTVRGVLRRG